MVTLALCDGLSISEAELELSFARSSGPGGQNVNKVNTKVVLRFAYAESAVLTQARRERLSAAFPSHVTRAGDFVVSGDRFRSQAMNQEDVLARLRSMILGIWLPPRKRVQTKPTRAARRRRVGDKRERGELKRQRTSKEFD